MVSPDVAVASKKQEIEAELEAVKEKYAKLVFDFAKKNSNFSRGLGKKWDYLERVLMPIGFRAYNRALAHKVDGYLGLSKVAINWHGKALEELNMDRAIRFKDGLKLLEGRKRSYRDSFFETNELLNKFRLRDNELDSTPECLLKEPIAELRVALNLKLVELGRISLDVFEGTTVMSGRVPERTEEDMEAEAL